MRRSRNPPLKKDAPSVNVRKAVIAVAGFGTRFLPATKVVPKELLPIVDKPVVQFLVEEAAASGIRDVILVTRPSAHGIAEHFNRDNQLESLVAPNPIIAKKLERLNTVCEQLNLTCIEQPSDLPYGNGSPLLAAKSLLQEDEPLVYMFGDDMVLASTPCVKQLLDVFQEHSPAAVVAAQNVPWEETSHYGIVEVKPGSSPPEMQSIVEKPRPEEAPSTLAQFGRFVLPYRIIEILENLDLGKNGELWLADATDKLCREENARVLVKEVQGTWFTIGDPLRFLIANVEFGLRDAEIGAQFATYLKALSARRG